MKRYYKLKIIKYTQSKYSFYILSAIWSYDYMHLQDSNKSQVLVLIGNSYLYVRFPYFSCFLFIYI